MAADAPLTGIRVLDVSTLFAGPMAATLLADFGADVVKVEHPRGDPLRTHGRLKDGHGLWWKMLARNKWTVTIDLSVLDGRELLRGLAREADVLIENFRPGVMERWGLGYEALSDGNPGLVMLRTTGFGQFGPYADRRGFGTLAESMSGFAALTGEPDGPPILPPAALADGIAGITGAYAVMLALYHRDARGGRGQVIDLAIIEPILTVLGAQPTTYDQLGVVATRTGNRSPNTAPRNTYRTRDGRWVAVSASTTPVAERVLRLVGRPDLVAEPWFASGVARAEHGDELDRAVASWIASRDFDEVMRRFEEAGAAVAPIHDARDVLEDPQYRALGSMVTLDDEDLGRLRIQNVLFRMLATPGSVRFAGRRLGQDTRRILGERLGLSESRLDELAARGVI
ncbi:MAG TPA: CoA transferase [Candidatus Eisenbacteria bacterium]|nr:CoA transferase [Candidatus Eisenbacteria bacterium]